MFSLICALNKPLSKQFKAGDLRRRRAHYDVIVMCTSLLQWRVHSHSSIWQGVVFSCCLRIHMWGRIDAHRYWAHNTDESVLRQVNRNMLIVHKCCCFTYFKRNKDNNYKARGVFHYNWRALEMIFCSSPFSWMDI